MTAKVIAEQVAAGNSLHSVSETPKFVDFSKRDITLPHGFKDLHQLLGTISPDVADNRPCERRGGVGHGEVRIATASEIPKYVVRASQTKAHNFALMIVTIDGHLSLSVSRYDVEGKRAYVNVSRESQREEFVERFLRQRLNAEKLRSLKGPFHIHYPILPIPDAEELARFATDLFGAFDTVNPKSKLVFQYDELM